MLIVMYFLLAGGPSLLVRLGAAWSGGADTRLLQLASTISEDLGRYFATVTLSNLLLGLGDHGNHALAGYAEPPAVGRGGLPAELRAIRGLGLTVTLLTVVAIVSFDGLGKAVAVASTYLALATIEGQIPQPVLVGRRLDVHPLVVLLSLWFGGWLWGIAGVALAMPLLVTAKALPSSSAQPGAAANGTPGATTIRSRAEELLTHGSGAVRHRRSEPERQ